MIAIRMNIEFSENWYNFNQYQRNFLLELHGLICKVFENSLSSSVTTPSLFLSEIDVILEPDHISDFLHILKTTYD